jgi:hypothetical protein
VFPIDDKGTPKSYLGISIGFNNDKRISHIYQPALIDQIVNKMHLADSKDAPTPLRWNYTIPANSGDAHPGFHGESYSSINGSVNYLACATRPDIANAVCVLASHASNPSKRAWLQLNNLVQYLKATRDWVLTIGLAPPFEFEPGTSKLDMQRAFTVFTDSDHASEQDCVSVSGYISMLYGTPIGWSSKKQTGTIALSSMEAEVVAGCQGTKEACWLRKLWLEFENFYEIYEINLAIDNQATIYFGNANADNAHVKHIDLRYQFIRNAVRHDIIRLWYCPSKINPADLFTKALRTDRHIHLMRIIGMRRIEEVC